MVERFLKLLDHSFLTRVGNLRTLVSLSTAAILIFTGLVLAAIRLLANAGVVPLVFVGVGLVIAGLALLSKVKARWSRAQDEPNTTIHVPQGRIPLRTHDAARDAKPWQLKAARAARQPVSMSASVQQLARAADYGRQEAAKELAQRYHEGKALRTQINVGRALLLSDTINGTADQRQVQREQEAMKWDGLVRAGLPYNFHDAWDEAAEPLGDGSALSLIQPTTDVSGVTAFISAKLTCLHGIIEQLDES
jgi:hypothetical protein